MPAKPKTQRPLPIPKEHGAWAMLGVPLVVGAAVALGGGRWGSAPGEAPPVLLLGVAALFLYLARYPLYLWARFPQRPREHGVWVVATAAVGIGAGALLVLGWGRWLLVPAGALALALSLVHLWLVGEHRERSVAGELLGVAGLTLTAPLAAYAASGLAELDTFALWLLCFLFFGASVFYVKMRVSAASLAKRNPALSWKDKGRLGWPVLAYHLGALLLVGVLAWAGLAPALAVFAFLPLAVHHGIEVARLSPALNIRRLGFTLFGHSLIFAVLLVAALLGG